MPPLRKPTHVPPPPPPKKYVPECRYWEGPLPVLPPPPSIRIVRDSDATTRLLLFAVIAAVLFYAVLIGS